MSVLKNRLITISGDPSSGKSTVIKKLREDYERQGYNVHIYSVGHAFREIAAEKGLTIEELNKYMAERSEIDELIDSTVAQRGKEINSQERPEDIYIFDSRLAFHNIPNSFSIRLTIDDNTAGKRAFNDPTRDYKTIEEATQKTKERKFDEVERYGERYGIDLQNPENYKLLIDTSHSKVEDIAKVIEQCLELELEGKDYGKMWTSPKKLLPLQGELDTVRAGTGSSCTLTEFIEKVEKEGYNPDSEIDVISVDNRLYIIEGHHRVATAGHLKKTLVPYLVLAKDDEEVVEYGTRTARQRAEALDRSYLWGHEMFFDEPDKQFSYNEIYPGIYDELARKEHPER